MTRPRLFYRFGGRWQYMFFLNHFSDTEPRGVGGMCKSAFMPFFLFSPRVTLIFAKSASINVMVFKVTFTKCSFCNHWSHQTQVPLMSGAPPCRWIYVFGFLVWFDLISLHFRLLSWCLFPLCLFLCFSVSVTFSSSFLLVCFPLVFLFVSYASTCVNMTHLHG